MRIYHRTTKSNADRIVLHGFDEADESGGGVLLSDQPLEESSGDVVFLVELEVPAYEIELFERVQYETQRREFLLPLTLLKARSKLISYFGNKT